MNATTARFLSAASMLLVLATAALAEVKLNMNVKDGDVISGEFVFRLTAESKDPVTQVEFYVGDDLRETDSSTPYEFRLDTLGVDDGEVRVTFAAYTSEAAATRRTVRLRVDNELGKGAQYHVDKGREQLENSKWDEAILSGRRALKIDPKFNPGRIVLARANFGKGVYDTAQKFAEDAVAAEPNNVEALQLVSAITLRQAFRVIDRGGQREESLNAIRTALKSAVESQRKVLDQRLETFGQVTADNRLRYADLAIQAGRYSLAIDQLTPVQRANTRDAAVANRLIYAQMRAGRIRAANESMSLYRRFGQPDGFGFILDAILAEAAGDAERASNSEREAIANDGQNLGVRTGIAYLALKRGRTAVLGRLAGDLSRDEGQSSEANYYLSTVHFLSGNFQESREAFERAVLADPAQHDIYVERANQAMASALGTQVDEQQKKYQMQVARLYFDTALVARPDSFEALTGLAILNAMENKTNDAISMIRAAAKAGPEYAAAHYALAAIVGPQVTRLRQVETQATTEAARLQDQGKGPEANEARQRAAAAARQAEEANREANNAIQLAGRLDKPNLEGRAIPSVVDAWLYFARHGRIPVIAPPRN